MVLKKHLRKIFTLKVFYAWTALCNSTFILFLTSPSRYQRSRGFYWRVSHSYLMTHLIILNPSNFPKRFAYNEQARNKSSEGNYRNVISHGV